MARAAAAVALLAAALLAIGEEQPGQPEPVRVPWSPTPTGHILVRAKIDGKGPYNFILDTGAPAVFLGTEAARAIGLQVVDRKATAGRFEIEGGIVVRDLDLHVQDPYQLSGMNALGLAGVRLDGVLGYRLLARYRIRIDPRSRHMIWTPVDFEPPAPRGLGGEVGGGGFVEQLAKMLGRLGNREAARPAGRGFAGIEIELLDGVPAVRAVIPGSPSEEAGIRKGDILLAVGGRRIDSEKELYRELGKAKPGDSVRILVEREGRELERVVKLAEGY